MWLPSAVSGSCKLGHSQSVTARCWSEPLRGGPGREVKRGDITSSCSIINCLKLGVGKPGKSSKSGYNLKKCNWCIPPPPPPPSALSSKLCQTWLYLLMAFGTSRGFQQIRLKAFPRQITNPTFNQGENVKTVVLCVCLQDSCSQTVDGGHAAPLLLSQRV